MIKPTTLAAMLLGLVVGFLGLVVGGCGDQQRAGRWPQWLGGPPASQPEAAGEDELAANQRPGELPIAASRPIDESPLVEPDPFIRLTAERDRLEAENRQLSEDLAEARKLLNSLQQELVEVRERANAPDPQLDAQRQELTAAMAAVERSRRQWEDALNARQREIDQLRSRLQRLARERSTGSAPATSPG